MVLLEPLFSLFLMFVAYCLNTDSSSLRSQECVEVCSEAEMQEDENSRGNAGEVSPQSASDLFRVP
jgi:hypothetical protein